MTPTPDHTKALELARRILATDGVRNLEDEIMARALLSLHEEVELVKRDRDNWKENALNALDAFKRAIKVIEELKPPL